MTPTELIAEVESIRAAFAKADAKRLAQGLPVDTKSAAELVREGREERTQQLLQASRGRDDRSSKRPKGGERRSR
jgi:hypothetical protein